VTRDPADVSSSPAAFDREYNDALALRARGDREAAVSRLDALLAYGWRRARLSWLIGNILLLEMDAPERAIPYLQQAVALGPRSKDASLSLVRALLGAKQSDLASAEARRFLGVMGLEDYSRLLTAIGPQAIEDGKALEPTAPPASGSESRPESPQPVREKKIEPPAAPSAPAAPPRLVLALILETAAIPGDEPYRIIQSGLADIVNRLRARKSLIERLHICLVTFAGRVVCVTELEGVAGAPSINTIVTGGHCEIDLQRPGLISALASGAEVVTARRNALRSRQLPCLRPWIVVVTGGEMRAGHDALAADAHRVLQPMRDDSGFNLFSVVTGSDRTTAALAGLDGARPLSVPHAAVGEFFVWLAQSLEAALDAGATGTTIQLPKPSWERAA
jgi:uncharacterized protein YegL